MSNLNIIVPVVRISFKTLGVKVAVNKAAKKIVEGEVIQMMSRTLNRFYYG